MEQNPFVKCVDIHNIIPEISSNIYYLFETGGPHYFSKCTCKVESIYKQNIWPFYYLLKKTGCLEQLRIEGMFQQALVLINALLTC